MIEALGNGGSGRSDFGSPVPPESGNSACWLLPVPNDRSSLKPCSPIAAVLAAFVVDYATKAQLSERRRRGQQKLSTGFARTCLPRAEKRDGAYPRNANCGFACALSATDSSVSVRGSGPFVTARNAFATSLTGMAACRSPALAGQGRRDHSRDTRAVARILPCVLGRGGIIRLLPSPLLASSRPVRWCWHPLTKKTDYHCAKIHQLREQSERSGARDRFPPTRPNSALAAEAKSGPVLRDNRGQKGQGDAADAKTRIEPTASGTGIDPNQRRATGGLGEAPLSGRIVVQYFAPLGLPQERARHFRDGSPPPVRAV